MKQAIATQPAPTAAPSAAGEELAGLRARWQRVLILAAGVVATHLVLYAPSLSGQKILLPLNHLVAPGVYLPPSPQYKDAHPPNFALSDEVLQLEFRQRFAAAEVRAGRVPLWYPYNYCGAPFVFCTFSPFVLPYYLFPHPITAAWSHVLAALVGAGGAYVFFRRALGVGFWPAVVVAWCFPLGGCVQLWLGFYLSYTFPFFPWLLVAADATVRRPGGWGGPALGLVTGLALLSGAPDIAGQELLACGLFALWRLGERFYRERQPRGVLAGVGALSAGWLAGILLAAIWLAPLLDYTRTGKRMQDRALASEERPPTGLRALPQMFLPLIYGSTFRDWPWVTQPGILQEGAAQAYAGLVAAFVLAPLGFARRRYLSINVFWVLLGIFSAAWLLDLRPLTDLLRLPGLNLMSHNRFLFVFCFATLAVAAVGLDALVRGEVSWHVGYLVPIAVLAGLGVWSAQRAVTSRTIVTIESVRHSTSEARTSSEKQAAVEVGRQNFQRASLIAAALCAAGLGLWLLVIRGPRTAAFVAVSCVLFAELLWFDWGQNPQSDPSLFYPPVPALTELARKPAGRIIGINCLPPMLSQVCDLRDLRGYDSVDPARIVELLDNVRNMSSTRIPYALTQWWVPGFPQVTPGKLKVLPVLSMLNLRYIIGRGTPHPLFTPLLIQQDDYWVYENPEAMPRAYVPARVKVLPEDKTMLTLAGRIKRTVTDPASGRTIDDFAFAKSVIDFDPAKTAYVPTDPGLPDGDSRGTAEVVGETPCEVRLKVDMQTPGLLVLADQFYDGWNAYLDGKQYPILPVNRAIRGVALPAGRGELVFRYEPPAWTRGLRMSAIAASVLVCWAVAVGRLARRKLTPSPSA
jgi:hypothetical protein